MAQLVADGVGVASIENSFGLLRQVLGAAVDVLRGADHFVRRQSEPANQRKPRVHLAQAGDDFFKLSAETGGCCH